MDHTLKILLVEDSATDADLLYRELKKLGPDFTSELVETHDSFENALINFIPDIILSDYSLPSFDGVSAFHIKQTRFPEIPFIIVSGTIGEENAVELIKKGVTDYVIKDSLFTLIPKITRALQEARERKEKMDSVERLKFQNEKLTEIAFLQSHQVRRPIASILGLISLFKFDNPGDPLNSELLSRVKTSAMELDNVIHEIVKKTTLI